MPSATKLPRIEVLCEFLDEEREAACRRSPVSRFSICVARAPLMRSDRQYCQIRQRIAGSVFCGDSN